MELTAEVYGVELIPMGPIIYYTENGEDIKVNDTVIVISEFGLDYGVVRIGKRQMSIDDIGYDLKPIIRKATEEDLETIEKNKEIAKRAFEVTKQLVKKHGLNMKVLHSKMMVDGSRLVIYFSSKNRVDFRELVKDIAKEFKTRIELRQVGARDEMKFIKGLGLCGKKSCCSYWLRSFDSITLKHAKRQQMMINTAKITGPCGRLLCCLKFEYDFYIDALKNIPDEGSMIKYNGKDAKVITVNVFLKKVTIYTKDGETIALPFEYFRGGNNVEIAHGSGNNIDLDITGNVSNGEE
ncbi:cell fate regulator YaaT (PSP1 superfamily) [Thermosipho japonicus]|uniref:Cell fate regulator YaaT (PSP1 superfamily) n=1 Tax=Thermosipho japonicus TaxID=90323 RepID=A0A841GQJ5_9BACT|nr:stage 0 sporulation family protein [Thermosipho japonicus]MBB6061638.1 cell fate regulator YaaT (PSP1 superfamily) [Thermosipho japonicus]